MKAKCAVVALKGASYCLPEVSFHPMGVIKLPLQCYSQRIFNGVRNVPIRQAKHPTSPSKFVRQLAQKVVVGLPLGWTIFFFF